MRIFRYTLEVTQPLSTGALTQESHVTTSQQLVVAPIGSAMLLGQERTRDVIS